GAALAAPEDLPPCTLCLLDVLGRPDALAALRAAGTVTPATEVVAVHLDHQTPWPEAERLLAAAGATALPDGAVLPTGGPRRGARPAPRRTLVLGGARSGKSAE